MIKIRRLFLVFVIIMRSSLCENLNHTSSPSLTTINHSKTDAIEAKKLPIEKSDHISNLKVNSSLKVAESRYFPVGHPNLIPQPGGLVSPFDVATFSNSLLPLISAGIREKVKDIAQTFNDGFDLVEESIRDGWRESPLNPHNFDKYLNSPPNLFQNLPFGQSQIPLHHTQPASSYHNNKHPKNHHGYKSKEKTPKDIETFTKDDMMHEYGINGYKHFEEAILREIEKQEELKVEATIHTLFNEGDRFEIIRGKPYFEKEKSGWKAVPAPTKTYDDANDITSQIISPLHTSIFSASDAISGTSGGDKLSSLGFHDFDNFDTIHSAYSIHEEGGESKVKPVKAKIASIRRITPLPPIYSTLASSPSSVIISRSTSIRPRSSTSSATTTTTTTVNNRRQHFNKENGQTAENIKNVSDTSTSASNEVPVIISASIKRIVAPPKVHIQSLTTSKPKNHANILRNITTENPNYSISNENSKENLINFESSSRFRIPTSAVSSRSLKTTTTARSTTTSSTKRPSRTVQREVSSFVDKARVTGYRGSVRYGKSTTKQPDKQ